MRPTRQIKVPAPFLLGPWDKLLSANLAENSIDGLRVLKGKRALWIKKKRPPHASGAAA